MAQEVAYLHIQILASLRMHMQSAPQNPAMPSVVKAKEFCTDQATTIACLL